MERRNPGAPGHVAAEPRVEGGSPELGKRWLGQRKEVFGGYVGLEVLMCPGS